MKKTVENRYPHSATLFRFCKEALEIRYEGNVKVIDQDVGAILGYDPADCSHWKKGKKNIRALSTLKSIADHLSIDERLLIDITAGRVPLEEAVFEYRGYGEFDLHGSAQEALKKEFFKNPSKWQKGTEAQSFDEVFRIDRDGVMRLASRILAEGGFTESPIYLPEVFKIFPQLRLESAPDLARPVIVERQKTDNGETVSIKYHGEMRPYLRFMLAKELFTSLVDLAHPYAEAFVHTPPEVLDILGNVFAGGLLVPDELLAGEIERLDGSLDVVAQLSDAFWISKSFMNKRLRDCLEHYF